MRFTLKLTMLCFLLLSSVAYAAQSRVVAVVNGDMISSFDLEKRLVPVYILNKVDSKKESQKETREKMARQILDLMIQEKILLQEAEKNGISIPQEALEQQFQARVASTGKKEDTFLKEMKKQGYTKELLLDEIKREIMIQQLISKNVTNKIVISDEDVEEYFNSNPNISGGNASYEVALLVYPDENTAKKYYSDLQKGKKSFENIAKSVSIGPNPENGGSLGLVPASDMAPELLQLVQVLKIGDVSPVIALGTQPAQIKLIDKVIEEGEAELDAFTKNKIIETLKASQTQSAYIEYLEKLKEKAIVDNRY